MLIDSTFSHTHTDSHFFNAFNAPPNVDQTEGSCEALRHDELDVKSRFCLITPNLP